jgi:hypothetical protein
MVFIIRLQFPDVTWKTSDEPTVLEEMDASVSKLTDSESLAILGNLDISQLAPTPSRDDIYGKSSVGTDYKSMFKDVLADENSDEISDASLDKILNRSKDSLKKDLDNMVGSNGLVG